ncbi:hypothetical protein BJ165DRAFT_846828 [Panaeolus papilionaceus]|nr:hypothetical protein BJ165DRAFT_846828 [Panaeolus papilionaceus]
MMTTSPELVRLDHGSCQEYRVINHSRRKWLPAIVILGLVLLFAWKRISPTTRYTLSALLVLSLYKLVLLEILLESILVLPPHGLQIEKHRGFHLSWPLSVERKFIPSTQFDDLIINEGLDGWNVIYQLTIVQKAKDGYKLLLPFSHISPKLDILLEVLHGIQDTYLSKLQI